MAIPQSITDARNTLATSRQTTAQKLFDRTTAQQNLDAALRLGDPTAIATAQAAFNAASTALDGVNGARAAEQAARTALNAQITQWLQDANHQPLTPDADFARMTRTDCPVAFFPLRLETRFDVTANVLHIRVYPDEFFSDIHEREMTPDEQAAGDAYWEAVGNNDGKETADLWAPVAKRYGVPRAAYIVNARDPSFEPPTPTPRATVPSRGAEAVLPDRWVALAYKNGGLRHFQAGLPIPEPIDLTANPSADDQTMSEVADGFQVPSTILWTVQYADALAKGMAIDIPNLATDELQSGFDRIVVLGVKTSLDPVDGTSQIRQLFDTHHYTRGLDLVPLGTPTNNVPGQPTPFTMKDPSTDESFKIERLGPQGEDFGFDLDYEILSQAFGFDAFTFLRGAVEFQQDMSVGQQMRQVAWSATLGYFMRQMMNPLPYLNGTKNATPIFDETTISSAKGFFTGYVSAQGPLPAFRVGAVPYGVLPAISLSRMVPQTGENGTAVDVMRKLLPLWQAALPQIPIVSASSADRNTDLMKVLSQKSGSDGVYIRNSLGPDTITNLFQFILEDLAAALTSLAQLPSTTVAPLGHPEWAAARIFGMTFLNAVALYAGPLVTAKPQQGKLVSAVANPTAPTDSLNYLEFLQDTRLTFDLVRGQGSMPNAAAPNDLLPLLYLLARHSMLLQYVEVGRSLLAAKFAGLGLLDVELWSIGANPDPQDVFTVLGSTPTGDKITLFQQIQNNVDGQGNSLGTTFPLGPLDDAFDNLSGRPVAELERVLTETLDLAAHRLDAHITGLATRRLQTFRKQESKSPPKPPATYLGGYGAVENVRPVTRTTRSITGIGTVSVQPDNGGYVHAPSLRHATAAAILRSGRMAEKSDPTKYAIELPSDRARRARLLVDGVRDGQSLGELLGFELESGLRARAVTGTEGFILALRQLYPLVANKSGLDPGLPADGIAATNVVDGQKVRQAAATPGGLPFGTSGLPPNPSAGQAAIAAEVQNLNDIVDAVGDLEMSETIFQIAAGDVASAEAAMNFLPDGSNPPQSEVTTSPTAGVPVSHRVALLLEGAAPQAPGWTLGVSLRAQFDAFVEAWVGSLLGNPSDASATVTFQKGGNSATGHVSLSDMKTIGPLDFLALAQSTSEPGQGSPLDRQLAAAFLAIPANAGATAVAVTGYDTPTSGPSIPQLIELGRALGAVLGGARELGAADLVLTPDDVDQSSLDTTVVGKASTAVGVLQAVVTNLDGSDPRTALIAASAYQAEAFPDPSATAVDLTVLVMNASGELGRRVADAQTAAPTNGASNSDQIAAAINQIRILFGRNTLAVLPSAVPPGSGELKQSLAALDRPLNVNDTTSFDPHQAPGRYLQQASRLHERLAAWRRFGLYVGAFGATAPRVSVAQLPFVAGEDWAGRSVPTDSRTSLLFVSANGQTALPDPTQSWRGLLLDQWTELVPANTAETGLAFHYDSQNSEAPQVILMGMHSGQSGGWTLTELQAIVTETLDLALIRPVDNDLVALGQLVPAICLASNSQNLVVSTNIGPNARENVPIVVT